MARTNYDLIPTTHLQRNLSPSPTEPQPLWPALIATVTIDLSVMTILICARIFVKSCIAHKHQIEDYLSYLAWALFVAYAGLVLYTNDPGLPENAVTSTGASSEHTLYYDSISAWLNAPIMLTAKLSVLFQIKRIFTTMRKELVYWVVICSMIVNTLCYTGLFFAIIFECWPREKIWKPYVKGKCLNSNNINLASGPINLISDMETLLLPMWAIWHLHMPIKRKLAASAVFGVGAMYVIFQS